MLRLSGCLSYEKPHAHAGVPKHIYRRIEAEFVDLAHQFRAQMKVLRLVWRKPNIQEYVSASAHYLQSSAFRPFTRPT